MPGITVGVDGSDGSLLALDWAMREAALRHAALTVLAVHEVAVSGWTRRPIISPGDQQAEDVARQAAEETVAKIAGQLGGSQPASVTVRATSGTPSQALVDASSDSDLIVVGSRGGGGFARLLVGSTSTQVVHHSACPVVVVRGPNS